MPIQTIDRGTAGVASDTFKPGVAFDTCQANDEYLDSVKPTVVETFAALATTPAQYEGMVVYLKQHTSNGLGGGFFQDSPGSISNDGGSLINNAATSGRHWSRIYDGEISVACFGALGNDSADDTAAWQAAVNAFSVVKGSSGAIYRVSDKITIPSNRKINLNGSRIKQMTDQREIFDASSTDGVVIINGNFVGKSESSFTNSSSSRAVAIKAGSATNLNISENNFSNFWYSPLSVLTAGENITFSNNTVVGPGSGVLGVDVNRRNCTGATILASGVIISNNDISETAQGIIIAQGSSRINISDNVIHDTINEHGIYVDTAVNDLVINDNIIKTCDGNGIKVQFYTSFGGTVKNINISNNSIFDVGDVGGDAIIVYNVTPTGSPLYGESVVIEGNNINGVDSGVAINVKYCKDVIIGGNQITHCLVSNAIFINNNDRIKIQNNSIDDTYHSAIYAAENNYIDISSNTITNPATAGTVSNDYGIYIIDGNNLTIKNNCVYGINTTTKYCLYIASGTESTQSVVGNLFLDAEEYAVRFASTSALREYRDNVLSGVIGESFNEPSLISIASAPTIKIPTGQKFVRVTGTTNISTISAQGHSGNIVTLIFDGILTVNRGSNVQISSNFTTSSQDTLTICSDGVYWYEISRAVC